jgi:PAS domain S-box-containing protein
MSAPKLVPEPCDAAPAEDFRELAILYELTSVLGESLDVQRSLEQFVALLARAAGADVAALFLDEHGEAHLEGARLRVAAGVPRPRWSEANVPAALADELLTAPEGSLDSWRNAPAPWHGDLFPWLARRLGRVTVACVHTGARALGALVLARFDGGPAGPCSPRLLARLARRVALVVDHARVYAQLANARLVTAVENAADAIEIADADGRIQYVNAAFETMTGFRREEAVGHTALELMRSQRHPRAFYDEIHRTIAAGRVWRGQLFGRRRDGTVREQEAVISPVFDDHGRVSSFVSVKRDVTDRRKLETRLAQNDRLAALGTLAAGVAHEINNPMTYVVGGLEVAGQLLASGALERDPAGTAAELREVLGDALEGAERVRHIVRGLKDFARPADGENGRTLVQRAIHTAAQMVQNEIRHRARFVVECDETATAAMRESALVQVVLNLLLNAAQAIRPGSVEENEIRVTCRPDADGHVLLSIRDTGAGMDADTLDRIFDPFFTTKRVGEGTGLGLSVCHGIVKAVGGEIHVESEPGRGAELTVTLPSAGPMPAMRACTDEGDETQRRARVLLVDDEPLIGQMIRRVLRDHDVTVCTSGREGLAAWLTGAPFDLALCDLMMPDLTGMEFHAQARQLAPGREDRILFITGGTFTPEAEAFVAGLARPPLEKPFAAARLLAIVREQLRRNAGLPEVDEPLRLEGTGGA